MENTEISTSNVSNNVTLENFPQCVLDRTLVNANTLDKMSNVDLSILAPACGKNRGAFVLDPPDGHTYGCTVLPTDILKAFDINDTYERIILDNITNSNVTTTNHFTVSQASDISKQYTLHNLTASEAVDLYDFIIQRTYATSGEATVKELPYGCDINGLATLENCYTAQPPRAPIRAATMAGMFTPALWVTNGTLLSIKEAAKFYTKYDFLDMHKAGLNMVQIPVDIEIFDNRRNANHWIRLLQNLLTVGVKPAKMEAILVLQYIGSKTKSFPTTLLQAVESAIHFCNEAAIQPVVHALVLPSTEKKVITAAMDAKVPLWLPVQQGDLTHLQDLVQQVPGANIQGAALDLSHTSSVADIASSTSEEDRSKLFYHESMACLRRAPLEYGQCYHNVPIFVSNGFDLAIDNCHLKDDVAGYDLTENGNFQDFGQCGRLNETKHSKWWKNHRQSFAQRQIFAYEKGLGWSYAAWKLYSNNWTDYDLHELGVVNRPAKLLSFRDMSKAGYLPNMTVLDEDLHWTDDDVWEPDYPKQIPKYPKDPVSLICLNPPAADFVLGDATLAPTPGPAPDCGNGWWNFSTEKCDYWIPPAPTPSNGDGINGSSAIVCPNITTSCPEPIVECPHYSTNAFAEWRHPIVNGFIIGVVSTVVIAFGGYLGYLRKNRYTYQRIPNSRV